jgi:hypothetical protein
MRKCNINAESMTFAATDSVIIGEKRVSVKKFMVYNMAWLNRNYILPLKAILVHLIKAENCTHTIQVIHQSCYRIVGNADGRWGIFNSNSISVKYKRHEGKLHKLLINIYITQECINWQLIFKKTNLYNSLGNPLFVYSLPHSWRFFIYIIFKLQTPHYPFPKYVAK